ncbi:MAG: response regulator [Saprospiraceae bacterium]
MKKMSIIEDNMEVRENLAEILELSNYEVITSENGVLGVEQALKDTPDLILCDVMMPEVDGFWCLITYYRTWMFMFACGRKRQI